MSVVWNQCGSSHANNYITEQVRIYISSKISFVKSVYLYKNVTYKYIRAIKEKLYYIEKEISMYDSY